MKAFYKYILKYTLRILKNGTKIVTINIQLIKLLHFKDKEIKY